MGFDPWALPHALSRGAGAGAGLKPENRAIAPEPAEEAWRLSIAEVLGSSQKSLATSSGHSLGASGLCVTLGPLLNYFISVWV